MRFWIKRERITKMQNLQKMWQPTIMNDDKTRWMKTNGWRNPSYIREDLVEKNEEQMKKIVQ